jgi:hypothetical protein
MAVLKSLSFAAVPKNGGSPVLNRRAKLIDRLEEQKALLNDPSQRCRARLRKERQDRRCAIIPSSTLRMRACSDVSKCVPSISGEP